MPTPEQQKAISESVSRQRAIDGDSIYLMRKHNWLPQDVMSMAPVEMRFALTAEMHTWTLPPEAR